MIYLELFWEFFKTGLFAVGGGMATIPFLEDMADKTEWFTRQDLANMIAVSESTPGPIGVNMATYVGFVTAMGENKSLGAVLGAVIATLGLVTPSVIVILIVAAVLKSFKENKFVKGAFYGLRPASAGLIAAACFGVISANLFLGEMGFSTLNWKGIILAGVLLVLTNCIKRTKNLHPVIFIALSAAVGIIFNM